MVNYRYKCRNRTLTLHCLKNPQCRQHPCRARHDGTAAASARQSRVFPPADCRCPPGEDPDSRTILSHFALEQPYERAVGLRLSEAETLLSEGKIDQLMETIIEQHDALLEAYDFVLCQGVVNESLSQLIDFDLNIEIAKNLTAPVIGAIPARGMDEAGLKEALRLWSHTIKKRSSRS
ncbi:MAG: AAA family ATPase [Campylobacterales bacterium]|nr:AAA family ATPase [Campylobacterales bacterium]